MVYDGRRGAAVRASPGCSRGRIFTRKSERMGGCYKKMKDKGRIMQVRHSREAIAAQLCCTTFRGGEIWQGAPTHSSQRKCLHKLHSGHPSRERSQEIHAWVSSRPKTCLSLPKDSYARVRSRKTQSHHSHVTTQQEHPTCVKSQDRAAAIHMWTVRI